MQRSIATKSGTAKEKSGSLVLSGVVITHPDRVISETGHITKGELAEYYAAVASLILPEIAQRPLSLLRCPSGIDKPCFFQRNPAAAWAPTSEHLSSRTKAKRMNIFTLKMNKVCWKLSRWEA